MQSPDFQVNHGAKGFHQIIDQAHGVAIVTVVQSHAGMKPCCDNSSCSGGTNNGVAIVEQSINAIALLITPKIFSEKKCPVTARALSFHIFRVTAANFFRQCCKWHMRNACGFQGGSLLFQLAFNDGCPEAFARRLAGSNLRLHAVGLYMMSIQRQQHPYGIVIGGTKYKWNATLGQGH
ncbi:hypothetical protein ADJ79_04940 [Ottowia sp. oral taxon 894]|nr:hypothetical protein ADJ79_04940 [Ottowia sp. oral taxon 894]